MVDAAGMWRTWTVAAAAAMVMALSAGVCHARVLKTPTPPRGWNSWDCFGNTNETLTLATADAMAKTVEVR